MFTKILQWTRIYLLIGILVSIVNATPVSASGLSSDQAGAGVSAPLRLAAPTLVSPANGSITTTLPPTLRWSSAANHFDVQIATDSAFTDIVIQQQGITYPVLYWSPGTGILLQETIYYWRVKAYTAANVASNWSVVWKFKTPLAPPNLVTPIYDQSLLTDRPVFDWDPVTDATLYILQASASTNFGTLLVNVTISATEYKMTKDLPQNKTLYWRVKAKNSVITGAWASPWVFKTGNPPTVPVLGAPANGVLLKDYTPFFNWGNSVVPAGTTFEQYQLQVDDNNDFSSPEIDTTTTPITKSDFTALADLASNTKFYWHVRAFNTIDATAEEHYSGWSTIWYFRTVILAPQNLSVVDNPANHLRPHFQWDIPTGTGTISSYNIQISTLANFSTLFINSTTVNPYYDLLKNLPANKTIYWRVRVNGANGPSAWSTTQFISAPAP